MISILKKMKLSKKRKGSATVEAALIFPLIMFIMFGIIYLTIVHYQNNVMIAESIRAMNRAGAYWQYIDMDENGEITKNVNENTPPPFDNSIKPSGIINIKMIKERNPYRTLIDVISEGISKIAGKSIGTKKANASQYVNARISNIEFKQYEPQNEDFTSVGEITGSGFMFFGEDLKIDIGRSYINPLLKLSKTFLGKNNVMENAMKKEIKVSSVISNQVEFIRNLDTVYDLGTNVYNMVIPKKEDIIE